MNTDVDKCEVRRPKDEARQAGVRMAQAEVTDGAEPAAVGGG